ncbi:MAG TPA: DUF1080 domain-containing protein [Chitinophagaceae bacterium]|nr:DUF1080 domain-containing protein [Chitinophagaceae bacterium]
MHIHSILQLQRDYRTLLASCAFLLAGPLPSGARTFQTGIPGSHSILGRWDITVHSPGGGFPSWLEVEKSGNITLVGRFVGAGGSARPVSEVFFDGKKMHFAIPPQWETGKYLSVEGMLQGDSLTGKMVTSEGKTYGWTGVRAPSLHRTKPPVWGRPVRLFSGTSLKGWHAQGKNQWIAEGGILRSPASGSNLVTEQTFRDFKLHIEFRYPAGSNSGVYLRGRYEIQIVDNSEQEPVTNQLASIYGFIAPSALEGKKPGEWQTYEVTLVGRMVTLVFNGKTVICNQEIPGITGGAIDSREGEPGPILLQGDHGPIDFRNIILTPAKD